MRCISHLAFKRIQYMYIVQSIVCHTSHLCATEHLCSLPPALHNGALLLTHHLSEVFPCSLQPSLHEAAGGAVGAVAPAPALFHHLPYFLNDGSMNIVHNPAHNQEAALVFALLRHCTKSASSVRSQPSPVQSG